MYAESLLEQGATPYEVAVDLLETVKQKLTTCTRLSKVTDWLDAEIAALVRLDNGPPVETDSFATAIKSAVDVPADGTMVEVTV